MNALSPRCPWGHVQDQRGAAEGDATARSALEWARRDLLCRAGRREVQLDRYVISEISDGPGLRALLDCFLEQVQQHMKTGLLALVAGEAARATSARGELECLAQVVHAAGLVSSPAEALADREIRLPVAMRCPVTGLHSTYSFFPVCFCRHADRVEDELYDVSLSCPWTAINTTSDAFAFALLVRDRARAQLHCEPFEIPRPEQCRELLDGAVQIWQRLSVGTIEAYARRSALPGRAVGLTADRRHWTAAHQDPAFAELSKERFAHEMPLIYARRLANKWFAALFGGEPYQIDREGQAGGQPLADLEANSLEVRS